MPATHRARIRARAGLVTGLVALATMLVSGGVAAATSGGWSNLGQGATAGSDALNGRVFALTRVGTQLYVGGDFTDAGGRTAADRVARWTGSAWAAIGAGITNGAVNAIAVDGSKVYVGGAFIDAGGDPNADHLAVWTGAQWQAVGGAAVGGTVHAFAKIGRTLYIGGAFANADGIAAADAVASYGLDSGVWSALTDGNGDIGGTVHALAPAGGGGLYVGGTFTNADGIAPADYIARWTGGTSWSALSAVGPNGFVRGLAASGADLYVLGDFINAGGIGAADKVARFDGSSWHALGSSSVFGESNLSLYDAAVDGSTVFVVGNFLNAGGLPKADKIAAFRNGSWTNVGTSGDGTDGPAAGELRTAEVVGARLYAGGFDTAIGDGSQNAFAAYYRLRQPDGRIKTTGSFAGNDVYNATGASQTRTASANQGATVTFTISVQNDGFASDSFRVRGAGSGGGFTVQYFDGATNITSRVVAGTYPITSLARGGTKAITLKARVGLGVADGATRSFLVTATSTGSGAPKDTVKATVRAT